MESVRRLALRMKVRRLTGTVVHHCAILVRMLEKDKIKSQIMKGYAVQGTEACDHYWVQTEDEKLNIDIGYELACLYTPELKGGGVVLLPELPDGLVKVDLKEEMIVDENNRLFTLFNEDPQAFWKEAPSDVKNFLSVKV